MDYAVGLVYEQEGKYLSFHHKKLGYRTIPIGKIEPGESPQEAMIREGKEELGIAIRKLELMETGDCPHGKMYLFRLLHFEGELKNNEPHKHEALGFVDKMSLSTRGWMNMMIK